MVYRGIIVEESLEDPSILETLSIISTDTDSGYGWRIHTVEITRDDIEKISKLLKEGPWYSHFWKETEILAVFKNKTFVLSNGDKSTWIPALKFGRFIGIPEDQLDFPTAVKKRVYVFIDASNVWAAFKVKARFLDYSRVIPHLAKQFSASEIKVFYYTAYPAEGTRSYNLDARHKLLVYFTKALGFEVRKKELKRIVVETDHGSLIQEKGNMDVEMTMDVIQYLPKYDIAILFSGDSDFLALVSYLRNAGKKVYIFSSKNNISTELKHGGDGYFDILDFEENLWGPGIKRRSPKEKGGSAGGISPK